MMTIRGKPKRLEEKRIYFHLSAINITRSHPGLNLRLQSEKPAPANQSYDMEWRVKYCLVLGNDPEADSTASRVHNIPEVYSHLLRFFAVFQMPIFRDVTPHKFHMLFFISFLAACPVHCNPLHFLKFFSLFYSRVLIWSILS